MVRYHVWEILKYCVLQWSIFMFLQPPSPALHCSVLFCSVLCCAYAVCKTHMIKWDCIRDYIVVRYSTVHSGDWSYENGNGNTDGNDNGIWRGETRFIVYLASGGGISRLLRRSAHRAG